MQTPPSQELLHHDGSHCDALPALALPPSLPLKRPPTPGIVSAIAGFINLVSSKNLLLELRGCQGIARICFAPPYGCPTPSSPGGGGSGGAHLDEAKAVVALLGGVQARLAGSLQSIGGPSGQPAVYGVVQPTRAQRLRSRNYQGSDVQGYRVDSKLTFSKP